MIKISLLLDSEPIIVGHLAALKNQFYFEYEPSFLNRNLNISPLKLPLKPGVFPGSLELPGVFNDSLPDGWGRLLLDRFLLSENILPQSLSLLDRLAYVGKTGMGALIYEPDKHFSDLYADHPPLVDLETVEKYTQSILKEKNEDCPQAIFEQLLALNGSSAGARPKAMIGVNADRSKILLHPSQQNLSMDYESWIVKFRNTEDSVDAGAIEYVYGLMAKAAGIVMPDIHLFPSKKGPGYFAAQRFDRKQDQGQEYRIHTHTAAGLLDSDFRIPCLDYDQLMSLAYALSQEVQEVENLFRLAVFNVLSHNRDDHGKNFTFLMDNNGRWKLSPAYDLSFSFGPQQEHSTMILGEGRKPARLLFSLGTKHRLSPQTIHRIFEETRAALSLFPALALEFGLSKKMRTLIQENLLLQISQLQN